MLKNLIDGVKIRAGNGKNIAVGHEQFIALVAAYAGDVHKVAAVAADENIGRKAGGQLGKTQLDANFIKNASYFSKLNLSLCK